MPVSEFKRRISEINYAWIPSSLLIDPTMRSSPIIDPMSRLSPCRTSPPLCPRRPPPTCQPSGSATRSPPWTSGQKRLSWFEPGEKSNLFSSWLYLEHNGLFILQEGNGTRGAVPQVFLKTLPWRDCGGGVAGEGRGGEGSLHWCACVLGCCQPQSRHLRRRDTENVEK